jgi:hypothetical protein
MNITDPTDPTAAVSPPSTDPLTEPTAPRCLPPVPRVRPAPPPTELNVQVTELLRRIQAHPLSGFQEPVKKKGRVQAWTGKRRGET